MPLYWGIVPEEDKKKVAARLHELVEKDDYHLDVGLLGSKALLSALSDNGYAETAYKVASQDTYPSWGTGSNKVLQLYMKIGGQMSLSTTHITILCSEK